MIKLRYTPLTLILGLIFVFSPPLTARAQGLPFGGYSVYADYFTCSCSGNINIWFAPLYLGGPIALAGPITYSPYATILYANFLVFSPGTWQLGTYLPGVPACWMPIGVGCVPFFSYGLMTKVGTSGIGL